MKYSEGGEPIGFSVRLSEGGSQNFGFNVRHSDVCENWSSMRHSGRGALESH